MDLFSDLIAAVQDDLTTGAESTLFNVNTTIPLAINRAYRKIGGAFRWPETEDAKKTSTQNNQEYYDYPSNWRPNTIWKLRIDGVDYGDPLLFKDYQYEKENDHPSGKKYAWSNQWTRFFIDPTPTANGTNNLEVWGQKTVDKLVEQNDTTIFSHKIPEVQEAIVLEAVAILRTKTGDEPVMLVKYFQGTYLLSLLAHQLVADAYAKIKQDDSKRQKTMPQFSVPDFFAPRNKITKIGDF